MVLSEVLKRNSAFVQKGGTVSLGTSSSDPSLLVLTCSCPEMTGVVEPALGLRPGEASILRVAGAWGGKRGEEILRSVAFEVVIRRVAGILVVGHEDCACCTSHQDQIEKHLRKTGALEKNEGAAWIENLRGPGNPELAVEEASGLLRRSGVVPPDVPVNGCMLELPSGVLKIIYQDQGTKIEAQGVPASGTDGRARVPPPAPAASVVAEVPLPPLPEISLPAIPILDLDHLGQESPPPVPKKKKTEVGHHAAGAGPVSLEEIAGKKDAVAAHAKANEWEQTLKVSGTGWTAPEIQFSVPKAAEIRDTGLGSHGPITRTTEVEKPTPTPVVTAAPAAAPAHPPSAKKAKSEKQSRAAGEAHPFAPAQQPVGERVLAFDDARSGSQRGLPRLNLVAGVVQQNGVDYPLPGNLLQALAKVNHFLHTEFAAATLNSMAEEIRMAADGGQPTAELLKLLIAPVIKLGKKRYEVINELLQVKEELPKQAPTVALAILVGIITGN